MDHLLDFGSGKLKRTLRLSLPDVYKVCGSPDSPHIPSRSWSRYIPSGRRFKFSVHGHLRVVYLVLLILCVCACSVITSVLFVFLLSYILYSFNYTILFLLYSSVWYSLFTGHRLCFLIKYSSACWAQTAGTVWCMPWCLTGMPALDTLWQCTIHMLENFW